jgi:uncharacterized protein YjbJ (UPF0337 family)
MGVEDKVKNGVQQVKGRTKEAVGAATDDPDLEREGQSDQVKGSLKQAAEKVKDAF